MIAVSTLMALWAVTLWNASLWIHTDLSPFPHVPWPSWLLQSLPKDPDSLTTLNDWRINACQGVQASLRDDGLLPQLPLLLVVPVLIIKFKIIPGSGNGSESHFLLDNESLCVSISIYRSIAPWNGHASGQLPIRQKIYTHIHTCNNGVWRVFYKISYNLPHLALAYNQYLVLLLEKKM